MNLGLFTIAGFTLSLDLVIGAILLIYGIIGLIKGFFKELTGFIATTVSFILRKTRNAHNRKNHLGRFSRLTYRGEFS